MVSYTRTYPRAGSQHLGEERSGKSKEEAGQEGLPSARDFSSCAILKGNQLFD